MDRPGYGGERGLLVTIALAQSIFPAPPFVRQGDFLFITTIYPTDDHGLPAEPDSISPYVGEAKIAAQTRAVLECLRAVLQDADSDLDHVLKAEVYLADPADFYEFKLVWQEYFPADPPAQCTAAVGDDHLVPGVLLSLSAVARVRTRQRLFEPTGHYPSLNFIPSTQHNGLGGVMIHELIIEIDRIVHRGHGATRRTQPQT